MQAAPSSLPARRKPKPWAWALPRLFSAQGMQAVTAVQVGSICHAARVQRQADGRLQLTAAASGPASELRRWKSQGLFKGSQGVLVLGHEQRQLLTLDRPEVPDEELAAAARFPLAEQFEIEPDQLLCTALPLPRINDAMRAQLLAVGAAVPSTRQQLAQLEAAGITLRSIDVADTALRGMALLAGAGRHDSDGWIVLASQGPSIAIGLLWGGDFCALRTLALPVRSPRDSQEFEEQLALHIQRTTDHFERQATALAIRKVLAGLPDLEPRTRESLRQALPLQAQLFTLADVMAVAPALSQQVAGSSELCTLACVAAARLLDASARGTAASPGAPA